MKIFARYFYLLLFYIVLSIVFWITWILKKENPKIESFLPSADLALESKYHKMSWSTSEFAIQDVKSRHHIHLLPC